MTDSYTNSQGHKILIADMARPHLRSALAKAIRDEDVMRQNAADYDGAYETPAGRQAEIDGMAKALEERDRQHAEAVEAGEGFRP